MASSGEVSLRRVAELAGCRGTWFQTVQVADANVLGQERVRGLWPRLLSGLKADLGSGGLDKTDR